MNGGSTLSFGFMFVPELKSFCPRIQMKTKKKVQWSSSAQMQTMVKLLEDAVKFLGGKYSPILPGFRHPW